MYETPDPDWFFEHVLDRADHPGPWTRQRRAPRPADEWRAWWRMQPLAVEPVRIAAAQGFVVTSAELRDAGVSRSAARHAVRKQRWCAPIAGYVAPLTIVDPDPFVMLRRRHALVATAGVLHRPGLVVSGRSAAILHGLPTVAVPGRAELTRREALRLGRRDVRHVFGATLRDPAIETWFGAPVTSVARTLVDLARHDRQDGLVAADVALRQGLISRARIDRELTDAVGWPGVRQARAILAFASPRAESPLESLVRLALHDAGFPALSLQVRVGRFRVDLYCPQGRLVVEVDGLAKYTDEEWRKEKQREQALRALGFQVERVTWDDLMRRWPVTVARLFAALTASPSRRWWS